MFFGSMVALVTPMLEDGSVDENALRKLVEYHISAGTNAIVVCGTTGESATLTEAEQIKVIKRVTELAKGKLAVIAGTGTNSTARAIKMTQAAMEIGVDACLVVTPYYNKPTQEGLFQHYRAIATQAPIPLILYNVPGRTSVDLLPETVHRLANIANIVGIKEATGDLERAKAIYKLCGDSLDIYSGDDATALDLMLEANAKGVISVTANVLPSMMAKMCQAALNNDPDTAENINQQLSPLHKALFIESNPIPVKWALHKMGLIEPNLRLPLTVLSDAHKATLENALEDLKITVN